MAMIKEMLDQADAAASAFERHMPMPGMPGNMPLSRVLDALIAELREDEVLTEATLKWVRNAKADIQRAKLISLYGQDWYDAKVADLAGETT